MKIIIKILKLILSIILIITFSLLIFANIVTTTILNKEYILNKLEETGYYITLKGEINSSLENYVAQSGFDSNVLDNILSDEKIKNDTKIIISNIYEGTNQTIDTTEIEQKLRNNIQSSLQDSNLNITQKEAINQYIETIIKQYENTLSHTNYEHKINNVLNSINKYLWIIKRISSIVTVIVLIILLVFNYKNILRAISQIGVAMTSGGLLYIIVNIFVNSKIKIENILVLNNSVSEVLKQLLNNILNTILNYGIIMLICGLIIIIVSNIIDNRTDKTPID